MTVTIWLASLAALTVVHALALAAAIISDMPTWLLGVATFCMARGTRRILYGLREMRERAI